MSYLRLRRSRVILGSFLIFALLISAFPMIDIGISRLFFAAGAFREREWQTLLKEWLGLIMAASFAIVVAIYVFNRKQQRKVCEVDGRRVGYVLLVAVIGAGLIVNVAFKNHMGRARPRDVVEFGGAKLFTPPFVMSRECDTNCSFSSGDAAGAFFSIALARALSRRRRYLVAAVGFGALVSFSRVSAGAHFFSDTVVSFFVMLIVADVLYYYMVMRGVGSLTGEADNRQAALLQVILIADRVPGAPPRTLPDAQELLVSGPLARRHHGGSHPGDRRADRGRSIV